MKLDEILASAHTIAIGGHIRPDGDCVGSCMGMYLYIREKYPEAQVDVYLKDPPKIYLFLKDSDKIRQEIHPGDVYDLFICQDCGDRERLDFSAPLFDQARHTLCIDHHISNGGFAEDNYIVPEASSTSELVYKLMDKEKLTPEIAEALYLGIVHDTGVFQYSCTSPETMRIAANLLETGIDAPEIIRKTYYEKSYGQNRILGQALVTSRLYFNDRVIVSTITAEDMEHFKVTPKALDGIVSQLRNTRGVDVSVFLYEIGSGVFKVSLRSGSAVDVSAVAVHFGGGGHVRAAGCSIDGTKEEVLDAVLKELEGPLGSAP